MINRVAMGLTTFVCTMLLNEEIMLLREKGDDHYYLIKKKDTIIFKNQEWNIVNVSSFRVVYYKHSKIIITLALRNTNNNWNNYLLTYLVHVLKPVWR